MKRIFELHEEKEMKAFIDDLEYWKHKVRKTIMTVPGTDYSCYLVRW